MNTVNLLLFTATLICELGEINLFAASNFHDQSISIPLSLFYSQTGMSVFRWEIFAMTRVLRTIRKFLLVCEYKLAYSMQIVLI